MSSLTLYRRVWNWCLCLYSRSRVELGIWNTGVIQNRACNLCCGQAVLPHLLLLKSQLTEITMTKIMCVAHVVDAALDPLSRIVPLHSYRIALHVQGNLSNLTLNGT